MAVSLCCPPETIRTLLISYAPMQSKKFFFKKTRHLFHHLKNRGSMQSIWNSAWEIFLFSHNYVLNHLFILAQAHGYLFHILDYNPNTTLFILLLKLFHWLLSPLVSPITMGILFLALLYFIAL